MKLSEVILQLKLECPPPIAFKKKLIPVPQDAVIDKLIAGQTAPSYSNKILIDYINSGSTAVQNPGFFFVLGCQNHFVWGVTNIIFGWWGV